MLAVYISDNNAVLRPKTTEEEEEDEEPIPEMLFDINADKTANDKQVQVLLNHAKTLVKKRIVKGQSESASNQTHMKVVVDHNHDQPATSHSINSTENPSTHETCNDTQNLSRHEACNDGQSSSSTDETCNSHAPDCVPERVVTIDMLQRAAIRQLDECWEVFEDSTPAPVEEERECERESEVDFVPGVEQERHPHNISFLTANPVGCGDLQC